MAATRKKSFRTPKAPTPVQGRGPNAKRAKIPKRLGENGMFTEEHREYVRDIAVCYDLVKMASIALKNPKIRLHLETDASGVVRPCTDGTNIWIPRYHPRRRLVLKHELAHIYFKSNLPLRLLFVRDLLQKIETESGKKFSPEAHKQLVDDLCFVINIFEDIRVNSLWGLLFPGAGRDMDEWYFRDIAPAMYAKALEDFPDGDIPHLATYIILLTLRQPVKSTQWGQFEGDIVWAADQVVFKTFNAGLLLVRDLLLKIARTMLANLPAPSSPTAMPNPTERPDDDPELQEAMTSVGEGAHTPDAELDKFIEEQLKGKEEKPSLVDVLTKATLAPKPGPEFVNDNAGFDKDQPAYDAQVGNRELSMEMDDLESQALQDLSQTLDDLEQNALDEIEDLQELFEAQSQAFNSEKEYLTKNVKARVVIERIPPNGVIPAKFDAEHHREAERWASYFRRILGMQAQRTDLVGDELDVDLYIQQRLAREPLECYRVDTLGRGFRLGLLVDLSGSMVPTLPWVEALAVALNTALDFPFVHQETWGFNSRTSGTVNLYKYPKRFSGLRSNMTQVEGQTPLSHAIQAVGRSVVRRNDDSHLFVISDGFPVYTLGGSGYSVNTQTLMNYTQEAVQELRRQHAQVFCFMLKGGIVPEPKDMNRMFGPRNWATIEPRTLYADAFRLIRTEFLRYVRTR